MTSHEGSTPGAARRTEAFLRLARSVGAFLHESQRERGVSALHVKSGSRLFAAELGAARSRTDARRRAATSLVDELGPDLLADVSGRMDRIAAAGQGVAAVREDIRKGAAAPEEVVRVFSALNAELLGAMDACVAAIGEGEERCLALAALAMLHAKEKTGVERARLGTAFVGGRPDEGDRLALAELMAAQATYLHAYSMAAPMGAAQMLRRVLAAPAALAVRKIEDQVMTPVADAPPSMDAGAWFSTITRKIEMLGDVADATLNYFPHH
jgi:hypothetical protein